MRPWPKTLRWSVRIASTFSVLATVGGAWAGPYADLRADLHRARTPREAVSAVRQAKLPPDRFEVVDLAERVQQSSPAKQTQALERLRTAVDLRADAEALPSLEGVHDQAVAIKRSPLYHEEDGRTQANWLSTALGRVWEWLSHLFDRPMPKGPQLPTTSIFGPWVIYTMWTLLGLGVAFFVFLAARHLNWRAALTRRAKAVLEEDEPERTVDEWLEQANRFEQEGRYREAVRCLYLACLLRFDEARVARFDRGQTNWEHLARIEASPKKPAEIDFRAPTQAFDRIWYGKRVRGAEDVAIFRDWYSAVTEVLRGRLAA